MRCSKKIWQKFSHRQQKEAKLMLSFLVRVWDEDFFRIFAQHTHIHNEESEFINNQSSPSEIFHVHHLEIPQIFNIQLTGERCVCDTSETSYHSRNVPSSYIKVDEIIFHRVVRWNFLFPQLSPLCSRCCFWRYKNRWMWAQFSSWKTDTNIRWDTIFALQLRPHPRFMRYEIS